MRDFFDTLESRTFFSATHTAAVEEEPRLLADAIVVDRAVERAAQRPESLAAGKKARTTGRRVLSVLSFRNDTSEALTFKLRWNGDASQRYTLKPGAWRVISTPAQALAASVKFDRRPGPKTRMISAAALPKPFVSGDPAGFVPQNPTDGTAYTFKENAAGSRVKLSGSISLDRKRLSQYRDAVRNDHVPGDRSKIAYPDLGSRFEVLSPSTGRPTAADGFDYVGLYNCIAWTIGEVNRWVDPITGTDGDRLGKMDALYAEEGYRRLKSLDFDVDKGRQKVVVYAMREKNGAVTKITHAALQNPDGSWSSKIGALALIKHWKPQDLTGPLYGEPVAVYSRRV